MYIMNNCNATQHMICLLSNSNRVKPSYQHSLVMLCVHNNKPIAQLQGQEKMLNLQLLVLPLSHNTGLQSSILPQADTAVKSSFKTSAEECRN